MGKEPSPMNNIFEQSWWLDAVEGNGWDVITIEENDKIVARWPFVLKQNLLFKQIKMPKLTQTLGIWLSPEMNSNKDKLSLQKKIIYELIEKIPKTQYFKIRLDSSFQYFLPFYWKGFSIKPLVTYKINDLQNLDEVYANFDKTAKKNIRSAEKKVIIKDDLDIQVLIDMMDTTFKAQNRKAPNSPELILNIDKACKKNNASKFLAAVDVDGNIHACSYFVYDENTCYYLISGSDPKYRTSGAQSLILWEAIKFASTVSKKFDFEGSMIEGIEKFFRQFGGKPITYYQITKLPFLFEIFELIKPRIKKIIGYK